MAKLSPNEGGCWFCHQDNTDAFDTEYDTYVHLACVKESINKFMEDGLPTEAVHMTYLLDKSDIPEDFEIALKSHFDQ
jgi:hypothetical protein